MTFSIYENYDVFSGWVEDAAPESYLNIGAVRLGQIAGREADAMKGSAMELTLRDMEKAYEDHLYTEPDLSTEYVYPYFG